MEYGFSRHAINDTSLFIFFFKCSWDEWLLSSSRHVSLSNCSHNKRGHMRSPGERPIPFHYCRCVILFDFGDNYDVNRIGHVSTADIPPSLFQSK